MPEPEITPQPEIKIDHSQSATPASTANLSLRDYTPARVSLRRTGVSLATTEILDFQVAHAQARDAVHATLDTEHLTRRLLIEIPSLAAPILTLASAAPDRATYLRRPDLGRTLAPASAVLLHKSPCDLVIIIADGLSATAIDHHAVPLLAALLPMLTPTNQILGPLCIATQARVAIADHIGSLLNARLSLILIGERPGLSSPDSLGAYITWNPTPSRTDADRNCISNIRTAGHDYATAAARIAFYCAEAQRLQLTGTALKEITHPQLNP
ncbi:ethanolamine ammonia-lyase subunit EutC [Tunturiibacter gelidiferens]|uniref:ethanolamine ammonia-lyase subunit EutC n=1 Tax=Tunturiibacter gelidiferens TaxID=3069689 RepID=UPI003D9B1015